MKEKLVCFAAGVLIFTGAVHAADLNYNFIEVGYGVVDFDDFDGDLKRYSVAGSALVSEQVYLFGNYSYGETDSFSVFGNRGKLGVTGLSLGAGYRHEMSRLADLTLAAAYEYAKVEGQGGLSSLGSETDNGYSLALGVRYLVAPEFELGTDVTYIDIGNTDDTILRVGGFWYLSELVAVGIGYFIGSEADGYEGRIRFKF
jgi:hypothetical protein